MTVTQLLIYPVKSLSGISVNEAQLTSRGFQFDRRWMIVDMDGLFISQRTHPGMASIKVAIENNSSLHFTWYLTSKGETGYSNWHFLVSSFLSSG